MEQPQSPIDQIITHAEDYLKTRQQLTQHVVSEKVVVLTSTLVTAFVFNDPLLGYWLIGAVYVVVGLFVAIFRNSILKTPVMNAMVKNIYNTQNNG
jgi:hypothetical protein